MLIQLSKCEYDLLIYTRLIIDRWISMYIMINIHTYSVEFIQAE